MLVAWPGGLQGLQRWRRLAAHDRRDLGRTCDGLVNRIAQGLRGLIQLICCRRRGDRIRVDPTCRPPWLNERDDSTVAVQSNARSLSMMHHLDLMMEGIDLDLRSPPLANQAPESLRSPDR
jgi:hypothetical protein